MNKFLRSFFMASAFLLLVNYADAQTKKRVVSKRPSAKRTTTTKTRQIADAKLMPVADTIPAKMDTASLNFPAPLKSLRRDDVIDRNIVRDRTPLAYENIREDDAVYRQRIWREIDVHEKMNLPFLYKAQEDNGDQRFISILLASIKSGEITAFSPTDDRFTTPITVGEISRQLVGAPKKLEVPNWTLDPDGSKGIMKDSVIVEEFNPDSTIEKYWIKEDVVFDKEASRMFIRILGIAPLKTIRNVDGSYRDVTPLFWVYYPDLRPMLARYQAYNGKNYGARLSWEELFENRMFASRIIKSTLDNPYDQTIASTIKDPILRLLEGDNVKEKIFNYEQDLWSY
ncbi:MAG: gliding motility protein GldN [Chitinophagaceae bacterium]